MLSRREFLATAALLPGQSAKPKPNIVLILADDLGYGDLGCYGNKGNRTPHLDRMAAEGLRFTDFHSNGPMCTPTRAALLTGLYQQRFGRQFESALGGAAGSPGGLPLEVVTLPERLREAGYVSGMFGKWHLGYAPPLLPTRQGFDEFRGLTSGDGDHHTQIDRSGGKDWWNGERIEMEKGYTADLLTGHSVSFLERHADRPFFLYVPHLAIHFPWQGPDDPPHRLKGRDYSDDKWGVIPNRGNVAPHVKAMVESLDQSVGRILGALRRLKLEENTLVIFTSDNGGYINYAGGFEKISSNGPLRGQKTEMFEGGHRVPAMMRWPGRIKPAVSHQTAMTFDLSRTILSLAGVHAENLDGADLGPLLFSGKPLPERTLFWRMRENKAVRRGPWKLVSLQGREPMLFDLASDIGENRDLATRRPEMVRELTGTLAAWEANVGRAHSPAR
ncbi:MAG: sulfatase [Acidimicrobiia bacterium]|nr:sulfatase [Acidimicrobiia bacterium]